MARAITEVRNLVQVARNFGDAFEPLKTPEEAVSWLESNKDSLATWGVNETQLQHLLKERPKFITMGVEPAVGGAKGDNRILSGLSKLGTTGDSPYRDTKKEAHGVMGDLLYKANDYKFVSDLANVLNKHNPEKYPTTITDLTKVFAHYGRRVGSLVKKMKANGLIAPDGSFRLEPVWGPTLPKGDEKLGWRDMNVAMANAASPGENWARLNPSGLWKPSQKYSQFADLFKAVGKNPGPFKDDKSWYRYSNEKQAKLMKRVIDEAKPHVIYIAKNGNEATEDIVKTFGGKQGKFEIPHVTTSGKLEPLKFSYHLLPHDDGTNTVVMFGNHPGRIGFRAQRDYATAIGEVGEQLHEAGTLPTSVGRVKIEG